MRLVLFLAGLHAIELSCCCVHIVLFIAGLHAVEVQMLSCSTAFFFFFDIASLPEEGQRALPVRGGADPGRLLLRAEAVPRLDVPGPLQEQCHLARPGVPAQVHVR